MLIIFLGSTLFLNINEIFEDILCIKYILLSYYKNAKKITD